MDISSQATMARMGGKNSGGGPVAVPLAQRSNLGMPSLDTGTTVYGSDGSSGTLTNYVTVLDYPGAINRMRIIFGKRGPNGMVFPYLPVTDDGSTCSGFLKLVTFPKGFVTVLNPYVKLPFLADASLAWTMTSGIFALGSAPAATDPQLTSTEADIHPAVTVKLLTYSSNVEVIGAVMSASMTTVTLRTGIMVSNPQVLPALTIDTSGTSSQVLANGTVSATTGAVTFAMGATIAQAHANAIATLNYQIEAIRKRVDGMQGVTLDGTSTASSVYLNFGATSDPSTYCTLGLQLGYILSGYEYLRRPGYIDIDYILRGSASSTTPEDVPPPYHGQL